MKAVYALYTKPLGDTDVRKAPSQWVLSYIEYIMLAYSAIKSKQHFGNVELVCDRYAAKLIEELQIPFDSIKVELDYCELKPRFWAAGKIHAYTKSQTEPFIMIDNDAGFHTAPNPEYLKLPYVCQSIHIDINNTVGLIMKKMFEETKNVYPFDIFHQLKLSKNNFMGGNAGVVIMNDMELKEEFERYTFDMMNNPYFDKILRDSKVLNPYRALRPYNVVVEENLLYSLFLRKYRHKPKTILGIDGYATPVNLSGVGYYHIWGKKKNLKIIKEYEKMAITYIPKDITERIYKYFKVDGSH